MRCPACIRESAISSVELGWAEETLIGWKPFYDESGEVHAHDPNRRTRSVRCSRGHRLDVIEYKECWCGWSGGENRITEVKDER